jgi:hypothetical protein
MRIHSKKAQAFTMHISRENHAGFPRSTQPLRRKKASPKAGFQQ